jgi:hypothetical protein
MEHPEIQLLSELPAVCRLRGFSTAISKAAVGPQKAGRSPRRHLLPVVNLTIATCHL